MDVKKENFLRHFILKGGLLFLTATILGFFFATQSYLSYLYRDNQAEVYENDFRIWKFEVPDGEPEEIPLALGFDPKINLVSYLRAESKADAEHRRNGQGRTDDVYGWWQAVRHHRRGQRHRHVRFGVAAGVHQSK